MTPPNSSGAPSLFGPPPEPEARKPEPSPQAPPDLAPGSAADASPAGDDSPGDARPPAAEAPAAVAPGPAPEDAEATPAVPAPEPPVAEPPVSPGSDPPEPASPTGKSPPSGSAAAPGYQVLALRYRPQVFSDLVGQDAIARTLQNAIGKGRIWNAFLFAGPRGVGKTSTARILAKALNCHATDGPNPEPCGDCLSCREIAGGYSRDVPEIDGASHSGVANAREIIETAHYAPSRDRFRIFLVDEVHMLSREAFNALLKTLEEPPPHVKFLFATTEIHKIPDTILSRCQEFEFRTVAPRVIAARLRQIADDQEVEATDDALHQVARVGQGSLRDALSAFDQVIGAVDGPISAEAVSDILGVPDVALCRRVAAAIAGADRGAVFEVVRELVDGGRDLRHFVLLLTHYLRDVIVVRAAPKDPELLEWAGEREHLAEFAGTFSDEDLLRSLDVLTQAEQGLRWSPEPRFHLEMALLKLVEMPRLAAFEDLVARLDKPPPPASPGKPPPRPVPGAKAPRKPSSRPAPARKRRAPSAAAPLGEVEPPPVVRDYQRAFGGSIVSTRRFEASAKPANG